MQISSLWTKLLRVPTCISISRFVCGCGSSWVFLASRDRYGWRVSDERSASTAIKKKKKESYMNQVHVEDLGNPKKQSVCMVDVEAIPEGLPFRVPGLDIQEFRGRFRVWGGSFLAPYVKHVGSCQN